MPGSGVRDRVRDQGDGRGGNGGGNADDDNCGIKIYTEDHTAEFRKAETPLGNIARKDVTHGVGLAEGRE